MARALDPEVEDALSLLEPLGDVFARAMFGGWGLYLDGRMFALIGDGQLYLKADDETREAFRAAGCRQFGMELRGKRMEMGYWTAPEAAEDDARELLPWARLAVAAATRAAAGKAARAAKAAKAAKAKKPPAKRRSVKR